MSGILTDQQPIEAYFTYVVPQAYKVDFSILANELYEIVQLHVSTSIQNHAF